MEQLTRKESQTLLVELVRGHNFRGGEYRPVVADVCAPCCVPLFRAATRPRPFLNCSLRLATDGLLTFVFCVESLAPG